MEEQVKLLEKRLEEQSNNMLLLMQMVKEMKEGSTSSKSQKNPEVNSARPQGMIPKLQFPTFDGSNPRIWIKKMQ